MYSQGPIASMAISVIVEAVVLLWQSHKWLFKMEDRVLEVLDCRIYGLLLCTVHRVGLRGNATQRSFRSAGHAQNLVLLESPFCKHCFVLV